MGRGSNIIQARSGSAQTLLFGPRTGGERPSLSADQLGEIDMLKRSPISNWNMSTDYFCRTHQRTRCRCQTLSQSLLEAPPLRNTDTSVYLNLVITTADPDRADGPRRFAVIERLDLDNGSPETDNYETELHFVGTSLSQAHQALLERYLVLLPSYTPDQDWQTLSVEQLRTQLAQ